MTPTMAPPEEILTTEAIQRTGFGMTQIWRLIHEGKVKARMIGRDWLIEVGSLDHYMKTRRRPGRPPFAKRE